MNAMPPDATATLDEAYQRLHTTGPEFEGWLSNHGPMAVEAMVRHGHAGQVHRWLDDYVWRLDEFPRGTGPIGPDWRAAMGDPRRIADWTGQFARELAEQPWRSVLAIWWPRLLPGVAASATHGVIRTGHAVRALLADGDDPVHVTELAHGLAYWAARWQPVPGTEDQQPASPPARPSGPAAAASAQAAALTTVPRLAEQSGGFRDRLSRLGGLTCWPEALATPLVPAAPDQIAPWLAGLADTAAIGYLRYGHGSPVMLVHTATAPTAILRSLPALPQHLWAPSAIAAWQAAAALTAIYAPAAPAPPAGWPDPADGPHAVADVFAQAVDHGDEHVIKFADTTADVYARTGNPAALAASIRAVQLVPRPA